MKSNFRILLTLILLSISWRCGFFTFTYVDSLAKNTDELCENGQLHVRDKMSSAKTKGLIFDGILGWVVFIGMMVAVKSDAGKGMIFLLGGVYTIYLFLFGSMYGDIQGSSYVKCQYDLQSPSYKLRVYPNIEHINDQIDEKAVSGWVTECHASKGHLLNVNEKVILSWLQTEPISQELILEKESNKFFTYVWQKGQLLEQQGKLSGKAFCKIP